MNDSVNSVRNIVNMEKSNHDIRLVKDIFRYVLRDYFLAVNWKPEGIFLEDIDNSPCNMIIKSAIKLRLDTYGCDLHSFYDEDFPRKDVIRDVDHYHTLVYIKDDFESKPFDFAKFLDYLCMCAQYTALSYLYGVMRAPLITFQIVCTTMQGMRECGKITENAWDDFENYCWNFVQTQRLRSSVRKH